MCVLRLLLKKVEGKEWRMPLMKAWLNLAPLFRMEIWKELLHIWKLCPKMSADGIINLRSVLKVFLAKLKKLCGGLWPL
jgi:hypothetical protein